MVFTTHYTQYSQRTTLYWRAPFNNAARREGLYIPQRGVQWKQGVVNHMMLCTILLYNTTPIHCTPLRLHPPLQSIQGREGRCRRRRCPARGLPGSLSQIRIHKAGCSFLC